MRRQLIAFASMVLVLGVAGCGEKGPDPSKGEVAPPPQVRTLSKQDIAGRTFVFSDASGQWTKTFTFNPDGTIGGSDHDDETY